MQETYSALCARIYISMLLNGIPLLVTYFESAGHKG
jgi:hypothetical protein